MWAELLLHRASKRTRRCGHWAAAPWHVMSRVGSDTELYCSSESCYRGVLEHASQTPCSSGLFPWQPITMLSWSVTMVTTYHAAAGEISACCWVTLDMVLSLCYGYYTAKQIKRYAATLLKLPTSSWFMLLSLEIPKLLSFSWNTLQNFCSATSKANVQTLRFVG